MLFVFEGNINGTGGDHTVSPTQRATLERHYVTPPFFSFRSFLILPTFPVLVVLVFLSHFSFLFVVPNRTGRMAGILAETEGKEEREAKQDEEEAPGLRDECPAAGRKKKHNEHQPIQKQYIGLGLSPGRGWERPTVGIS